MASRGEPRCACAPRRFVQDDQLRILAELDGWSNVVATFVYGEGINVPELMVNGGRTYRLVKDHLGSVRLVVDTGDGTIVQEMRYDAWGNVTYDSNPGFQPFGFAGGLYDPQTRLVRFGARDYDASIGRWMGKDPAGFTDLRTEGIGSLFVYGANSPLWWKDPTGQFSWGESACIGPLGHELRAACGFLNNPLCRRALERYGQLDCMEKACRPDSPCPRIYCSDMGSGKPCGCFGCVTRDPCGVWVNRRPDSRKECPLPYQDIFFHEFLHFCGFGEPYPDPNHDPRAAEVMRLCTGKAR